MDATWYWTTKSEQANLGVVTRPFCRIGRLKCITKLGRPPGFWLNKERGLERLKLKPQQRREGTVDDNESSFTKHHIGKMGMPD